tara:strand:+ start:109 stop:741 length:633 start_codon:yes stop_codon:yes gene_type:complete
MPIAINGTSGVITGVATGGLPDGIVDTDMLAAGAVTAAKRGSGAILQVQHVFKGDRFSTSSTSWADITNLSISITPRSSSNKILVMCHMGAAGTRQSTLDHGNAIRVMRDIGGAGYSNSHKLNGNADSNRDRITYRGVGWSYNSDHMPGGLGFSGVDDPSTTSAVTYKVQIKCQDSNYAFYLNGNVSHGDNDSLLNATCMTSLIAMEFAG